MVRLLPALALVVLVLGASDAVAARGGGPGPGGGGVRAPAGYQAIAQKKTWFGLRSQAIVKKTDAGARGPNFMVVNQKNGVVVRKSDRPLEFDRRGLRTRQANVWGPRNTAKGSVLRGMFGAAVKRIGPKR